MATKSEIAWAAGLFEGEGCFHAVKTRQRRTSGEVRLYVYARIIVTSTDLDVLKKFQRIAGAGSISVGTRKQEHHKTCYMLSISSGNVYRIADLFWPWLGERRKLQLLEMEEAVELNAQQRSELKEHK